MATTRMNYGTSTTLSITLANLANSGARASLVVNNSSNLHIDALVGGKFVAPTGAAPNSNGTLRLYAYGSSNEGTNYSDAASGTDVAHTLNGNAMFLGHVVADSIGETGSFGPYSIAAVFGGMLPKYWGVIVENATGRVLNANAAHYSIWYQGVNFETS